MTEEMSRLSKPKNAEEQQEEVQRTIDYIKSLDISQVRCLAVCIIKNDPTEELPNRVEAFHSVIGSKAQIAAMLASTYSTMGRTFDAEKEAAETPKEKVQ